MSNDMISVSVAVTTILTCALTATAYAAAGETTWTGYLYQGPGSHYSVVDELAQSTKLDVIGCAREWCEVRVGNREGYVLAEIVTRLSLDHPPAGVLAQPATTVEASPPKGPCFEANQTGGNGGSAKTVFCGKY